MVTRRGFFGILARVAALTTMGLRQPSPQTIAFKNGPAPLRKGEIVTLIWNPVKEEWGVSLGQRIAESD
jgi:hypothetical protein